MGARGRPRRVDARDVRASSAEPREERLEGAHHVGLREHALADHAQRRAHVQLRHPMRRAVVLVAAQAQVEHLLARGVAHVFLLVQDTLRGGLGSLGFVLLTVFLASG